MKKFKVLVTSTSFQDSNGSHHELLAKKKWDLSFMRGPLNEIQLLEIIDKYDGIICGDDSYTQKVLKKGSKGNLKVLSKYGVGLDKIDLEFSKEKGIIVKNCPGINQNSVAEHVLALIFTFSKNIHKQYNSVQNYSWSRTVGFELRGKTIGIIGLGNVGNELALKAMAIGMNVIGYDLNYSKKEYYTAKSIFEIYENSDIISLNLPLNNSTHNLINYDIIFNHLRKNPLIVNTSRGGLVNSYHILEGLNKNKITGYLTDVLEDEPVKINEILVGHPNIIITPHISSRTKENIEKQAIQSILNLEESLNQL